jgi:hypothetical protein
VLLVKIDRLASNRSDFIRKSVEEKVERARCKRQSAWHALRRTQGLKVRIKPITGNVQLIDL